MSNFPFFFLDEKMKEKNIRMITETEIPYAIVYASIEQYCNPKFHLKNFMKRKSVKKDTSEVLALDTQDVASQNNKISTKKIYISETEELTLESSESNKLYFSYYLFYYFKCFFIKKLFQMLQYQKKIC